MVVVVCHSRCRGRHFHSDDNTAASTCPILGDKRHWTGNGRYKESHRPDARARPLGVAAYPSFDCWTDEVTTRVPPRTHKRPWRGCHRCLDPWVVNKSNINVLEGVNLMISIERPIE